MIHSLMAIAFLVGGDGAKPEGPIKAAAYPGLAARIPFFEKRLNSADPRIREEVIRGIGFQSAGRDVHEETARLFKRLCKDPDPHLRGLAVHALHQEWIAIAEKDLPRTFTGYHRDQKVDLDDKELVAHLIKECELGGPRGGYAAYVLSLVPSKQALASLRKLGADQNIFARYMAARALIHSGDNEGAKAILEPMVAEAAPVGFKIGGLDPYYVTLACRAYMNLGPREKTKGIGRLVALMELLDDSPDANDQNRLQFIRWQLAAVSGEYFETPGEARAWLKRRAK
ncbi:MAG: HEAT repeat domain-containing protein [Planctomycetes bacterium]|nr:HEAT repeat domain-containing protein [Planctomycetota bacterium]